MENKNLRISDYEVMRSAAGYYVGRWCMEDDIYEPYDRVSGYFRDKEEALKELQNMLNEN